MYCYEIQVESEGENRYNVGFYKPSGAFVLESTVDDPFDAARRVNYLNGGTGDFMPENPATD